MEWSHLAQGMELGGTLCEKGNKRLGFVALFTD